MKSLKNLFWLAAGGYLIPYSLHQLYLGFTTGVMEISNRHGDRTHWSLADHPVAFWIGAALWVAAIFGGMLMISAVLIKGEDV